MNMKALIIEDEPFAQVELKRLIQKVDKTIEIMGCLSTVEESIDWFKSNHEPNIVFMDVQLSDGLSFDIFDKVEITAPIVFVTAFDEYAIKAFEQNSIDYLLKPVEFEDLKKALKKYDRIRNRYQGISAAVSESLIEQIAGNQSYKSRFLIKRGEIIKYIFTSEIAYFYSSAEITYMITHNKKKYALDYTLDELIKKVDPDLFFRASRKYIASISSIEEVRKHFNSRLKLILNPPSTDDILVSRARVSEFLTWLEK